MRLYQLRKPVRPVLFCLLFILAATATLVFSLQTLLDALMLENSRDQYAYVGTVHSIMGDGSRTQPIPQEITQRLLASENVTDIHKMEVRAGKLLDRATVPDYMMTRENLTQHYFVEGTVIMDQPYPGGKPGSEDEDEVGLHSGMLTLRVDKRWSSDLITRESMAVYITRLSDEKYYQPGDRLFMIGDYFLMNGGVRVNELDVTSPKAREYMSQWEWEQCKDDPLRQTPYFEIPKELSPEESEAYILEKLEETGILPLYEKYEQLQGAVTVRCVSDMSQLPYMAKGKIYIDVGRQLYESDKGKKVCVVSQGLMLRNRLVLGDTISLSVADGAYVIGDSYYSGAGWESGFPMKEEELLTYAPAEEYEIVGFYHQLGRATNDPFYCSFSDVFIPVQEDMQETVNRPYTLSFRVPGEKYEAFLEETEGFLQENHYRLMVVDNGWEDVADSFYAMQDRMALTLVCAVLCFMAAALSFGGLIFYHYRREYGLCRLLGAYKKEARRVYFGSFWLSGLPGAVIAVGCTWLVYIKWMQQAAFEAAPITMPSDLQCVGLLLLWTAAILLVGAVFLLILMKRSEKKGILRMI